MSKVLSVANLQLVLVQFIYLATIVSIGAWLMGKSIRRFVLGFPLVYGLTLLALVAAGSSQARGFGLEWFALAFTSIGLETNSNDLFKQENKRPFYAFLLAQTFNIFITLAIAPFLFR